MFYLTYFFFYSGFYQCIASNPLGEVTASAALSFWPTQTYINPPFVMRCIPLTKSTIYLTWKTPEDIAVVAHTIHYLSGDYFHYIFFIISVLLLIF